eukprot:scaffold221373_cov42-Prasinocladus_malaysianus.AAC.1
MLTIHFKKQAVVYSRVVMLSLIGDFAALPVLRTYSTLCMNAPAQSLMATGLSQLTTRAPRPPDGKKTC